MKLFLLVLVAIILMVPSAHAQAQTCTVGETFALGGGNMPVFLFDTSVCTPQFPPPVGGWYPQCDQYGYMIYGWYTWLLGYYDPDDFASWYGCFPY